MCKGVGGVNDFPTVKATKFRFERGVKEDGNLVKQSSKSQMRMLQT